MFYLNYLFNICIFCNFATQKKQLGNMVKLIEHKWLDWQFTWANNVYTYSWTIFLKRFIFRQYRLAPLKRNLVNRSREVIQSQIWVIIDYLNERGGCSSREAVHSTIANRYWLTESAPNDKRLSIPFFVFRICIFVVPSVFAGWTCYQPSMFQVL